MRHPGSKVEMSPGTDSWRLRLARPVLRSLLAREAKRTLSSRTIIDRSGTARRWLKEDMKPFVAALDEELVRLHPIARQNELPSFGNKLMVEAAIVTVALHQALRRLDVDADCSRELVADSIWSIYRKSLWLASLPARLLTSDPGRRLRWTIRTLLRFPFNAPGEPGYAVEARIEGEDILTHFTHCPPQTFARRVADETGDPEALRVFRDSWCLYDWPGADLIAGDGNRGHYRRPHTLSHGDPVCDMCWAARASEKPDG